MKKEGGEICCVSDHSIPRLGELLSLVKREGSKTFNLEENHF